MSGTAVEGGASPQAAHPPVSTGKGMLRELASQWIARRAAFGLKGKKADAYAFEFFIGAAAALDLAGHPAKDHVLACISLVLATAPWPQRVIEAWSRGEFGR